MPRSTVATTVGRLTALAFVVLAPTLACEGTPSPNPEPGVPDVVTPEPGTPGPGTPEPGTPTPEPGTPSPEDDGGTAEPEPIPGAITPSVAPKVKFIGGARLRAALAQSLDLPLADVCKELGTYDCVDNVHKISLGGVDPEFRRIDEPFKDAPIATPIAVDRVALNACSARSALDFATPESALIFGPLATSTTGLSDTVAIDASVSTLFQRMLRRAPTDGDIEKLRGLAEQTVAASESSQTFATLACFVAATTMENLFY